MWKRRRYQYIKRSPKARSKLILLIILVILVIWLGTRTIFKHFASEIISPLDEDVKITSAIKTIFQKEKKSNLDQINPSQLLDDILKITDEQPGSYSVYLFDVNQKSGFGFNETTIMTAASLNKIPVLAALYYEAQSGNIDLDRRITLQKKDIQAFGTGILQNKGPGGIYSLKTLAQLMIEKSDNTAVFVLTQILRENRIQELIDSWGLQQTNIVNNKTSNQDMAHLFVKMYQGKIANEALTLEMIGFMDDSDFENRLPALLPEEVDIYHKIGSEVNVIHDVGIVALKDKPYYIGVMVNDVVSVENTENTIAQISKMAYEYMTQK